MGYQNRLSEVTCLNTKENNNPISAANYLSKTNVMGYQNRLSEITCLNMKKNNNNPISAANKQHTDA